MQEPVLSTMWEEFLSLVKTFFYETRLVWMILAAILLWNIVRIVAGTLLTQKRQEKYVFFFNWLCVSIFVWTVTTLLTLLPFFSSMPPLAQTLTLFLARTSYVYFPALVFLHIWRQLSYRDVTWQLLSLYLGVPTLLFATLVKDAFFTATVPPVFWLDATSGRVLYFLYFVAVLVNTYLLMFSVYYQMPAHMRKSTRYMIIGVSFIVVAEFLRLLVPELPPFDFTLLAAHIMLDYLYFALSTSTASNVIVTSRDFVFDSLSTMVIILSKKKNILDWNHKFNPDRFLLPVPVYGESFANYQQRILDESNGRVSAHDKNIISTWVGDEEGHYLITTHEVNNKSKHFGYLVEISEVTKIYRIFRYLEENATRDQLTGLYNRNAYMNVASDIVKTEHLPLLIAVGDVNNLKPINDIYGHLAGDQLLKTVAAAILEYAPPNAFIARIGGDEFVMLVPTANPDLAAPFVEQVNQQCANNSLDSNFKLSISWGYSMLTDLSQPYNEVFDQADAMMYATKKKSFRFHSSGTLPNNPPPDEESPPAPPMQ